MPKRSKSYKQAAAAYDKREMVALDAAVRMIQSFPKRGFDESVELSFNLGIDGRQADQSIRGTVMLPPRNRQENQSCGHHPRGACEGGI